MIYDCGASADSAQVKYKYVVDGATWEGDYDFGHYATLDPLAASQRVNVWWNDHSPADYTTCDVEVRFQVANAPACTLTVVGGDTAPLNWAPGVALVDDGTNGDLTAADGIYSALVTFPTGSYRYVQYKHACDGAFECDTYPNRTLTLDDVNHCVTNRSPMETLDLWNWCVPTAGVAEEAMQVKSWGQIKALYR